MRSRRPVHHIGACDSGAERQAARNTFGGGEDVGRDAEMFGRPHPAGSSHAGLHFIEDQQNSVTLRETGELFEEIPGRNYVATFALDRLNDDSRYFVGGKDGAEQVLFDDANASGGVIFGSDALGTTVGIGIFDVEDAGNERTESFALDDFTAGERQRSERATVKCAAKSDEFLSPGGINGSLQCALDGVRAGVAVVSAFYEVTGSNLIQYFG